MAIIMVIVYFVFLILLLYATAKTRDKINTVSDKLKKH